MTAMVGCLSVRHAGGVDEGGDHGWPIERAWYLPGSASQCRLGTNDPHWNEKRANANRPLAAMIGTKQNVMSGDIYGSECYTDFNVP
jgi:hypothetical protein